MPVADHGQWDTLDQLSDVELLSPYSRLLAPLPFVQLSNAVVDAHDHPPLPADCQQFVLDRVPTLQELYDEHPETDPLFLVDELLDKVPPANPPPGTPRSRFEYLLLMCLHRDPPANVNALNPNAPPGPTVNYVKDREFWLDLLASGMVLYVTECARVCVSDPRTARATRLGQVGPSGPNARLFKVMTMIASIELASILQHLHVVLANVVLMGCYTFGGEVKIDYHPRIGMTSRHIVVRTLWLARICLRDEIEGKNLHLGVHLPASALFASRAASLPLDVHGWGIFVAALGLAPLTSMEKFEAVSRFLQDYISENGTGAHGGGAGPDVYILTGKKGGCSMRRIRKKVPITEDGTLLISTASSDEESELTLVEVAQSDDVEQMALLLEGIGIGIDGGNSDHASLKDTFERAMPCIELMQRLSDLDLTKEDPVSLDHPAILRPDTADSVLRHFDSGLSRQVLLQRVAADLDAALPGHKTVVAPDEETLSAPFKIFEQLLQSAGAADGGPEATDSRNKELALDTEPNTPRSDMSGTIEGSSTTGAAPPRSDFDLETLDDETLHDLDEDLPRRRAGREFAALAPSSDSSTTKDLMSDGEEPSTTAVASALKSGPVKNVAADDVSTMSKESVFDKAEIEMAESTPAPGTVNDTGRTRTPFAYSPEASPLPPSPLAAADKSQTDFCDTSLESADISISAKDDKRDQSSPGKRTSSVAERGKRSSSSSSSTDAPDGSQNPPHPSKRRRANGEEDSRVEDAEDVVVMPSPSGPQTTQQQQTVAAMRKIKIPKLAKPAAAPTIAQTRTAADTGPPQTDTVPSTGSTKSARSQIGTAQDHSAVLISSATASAESPAEPGPPRPSADSASPTASSSQLGSPSLSAETQAPPRRSRTWGASFDQRQAPLTGANRVLPVPKSYDLLGMSYTEAPEPVFQPAFPIMRDEDTYPAPRAPDAPNRFKGKILWNVDKPAEGSWHLPKVIGDSWDPENPMSEATITAYVENMVHNPHMEHVTAVHLKFKSMAPCPQVEVRIVFRNNTYYKAFMESRRALGMHLSPPDDFYPFHERYWRRKLKVEVWAQKGNHDESELAHLSANWRGSSSKAPVALVCKDPVLGDPAPGYPPPRGYHERPRFGGQIQRGQISLEQKYAAAYTLSHVVQDSFSSATPFSDKTLVAFAEQIVGSADVAAVKYIATACEGPDETGLPLARVAIIFSTNKAYSVFMTRLRDRNNDIRFYKQPAYISHNRYWSQRLREMSQTTQIDGTSAALDRNSV